MKLNKYIFWTFLFEYSLSPLYELSDQEVWHGGDRKHEMMSKVLGKFQKILSNNPVSVTWNMNKNVHRVGVWFDILLILCINFMQQ